MKKGFAMETGRLVTILLHNNFRQEKLDLNAIAMLLLYIPGIDLAPRDVNHPFTLK